LAGEHFKEVGGNYNFIILDRTAGSPERQYRQIFDDPARLTTELVRAVRAHLLERNTAEALIDDLVFKAVPVETVEKAMFAASVNAGALELVLRGYKRAEIDRMETLRKGDMR
ncbi:hypothetical protein JXA80_00800, partial [bacterium]|nr:hypothetical protein [candidate division CSSED10-310 bacterium]